jgi:ribA/ribD-fused uncharacterized protein
MLFFNSEQAFMWEKAIAFGDMETAALIMKTPNPSANKQLGRQVRNFDAKLWSKLSYKIMVDVNYAKFSQNSMYKNTLLSTGDKKICEASPTDSLWGIGLHWTNDDVLDESKWQGQNLLGKALMEVRDMFRSKMSKEELDLLNEFNNL